MLPLRELLAGSRDPAALEPVLRAADQALRTWEPVWTPFLPALLREEAERQLSGLVDLVVASNGGYDGAERRRLLLQRVDAVQEGLDPALMGLELGGNFLFDPATAAEFRQALEQAGAEAGAIGDVWLRGDRGAQAIVTADLAQRWHGQRLVVRTTAVELEARALEQLQRPASRQPRPLASVEASLRLDALASAGFGLSRTRMADLIRQGGVRLNWQPVTSPSRELQEGDRVQLEGRGELRITSVTPTKRGRLRIAMERS